MNKPHGSDIGDYYAMPAPSPDNCRWCGFPLTQGEHGIFGPGDLGSRVSVKCKIRFDLTPKRPCPRLDSLYGHAVVMPPQV